ncbi:MAG: GntR family transcriptional regulator [Rubellimicrobium sp.]|nr:GntR family transcriptional regulator [Rubellimicrobium sp.]
MTMTKTDDLKIERVPQTLRTMVLDRMRGAILSGRFQSGERLIERSLCDQLGVSRSVVREVIRYLEAEGLVETLPNRGPIVARMDWPTARQIYDIRLLLEQSAARACALRIDDVTRAQLRLALAGIAAASTEGQAEPALFQATTRFYECIFMAAGHVIAWETVQRLDGRISRLRALTLLTTDRSVSGLARMTQICEAICSGDQGAAAQAVRGHLDEAAEIARRILEQEEARKSV